jgi:hypothetical protein
MNCPRCRTLIVAEDVNLNHLLAKCRACQEVFRFAPEEIEAVTDRVLDKLPPIEMPVKPKAPRPDTIFVEDWGPQRKMIKRWLGWHVLGMAMFCVLWDGFLIVWYSIALGENGNWFMAIFPLLHVSVGVSMTYTMIANLFNRTEITLDDGDLEVCQGPVPWPGNTKLKTGGILQFYCTLDTGSWFRNQNRVNPNVVAVNALMANGVRAVIVGGVSMDEGLFIEQQLEEWLEIVPKRVPGQVD